MSLQIGIITEDESDVAVMKEFIRKLIAENAFSVKKFAGHGCGKLKNKCRAWCSNFIDAGCTHIILVHDLDRRKEKPLRRELDKKLDGLATGRKLILIPTVEIEAWLLCDPAALKKVFRMDMPPKLHGTPESIPDAKKYLRDVVWKCCKKRYINTFHNEKIAKEIKLTSLTKCPSFAILPPFLVDAMQQAPVV